VTARHAADVFELLVVEYDLQTGCHAMSIVDQM
jgi:hypothetical protein